MPAQSFFVKFTATHAVIKTEKSGLILSLKEDDCRVLIGGRNLYILQIKNASVNANASASVKLSATQQKIINCLKENSGITVKDIDDILNRNELTIVRNIVKLNEQGLIGDKGSDKAGSWK